MIEAGLIPQALGKQLARADIPVLEYGTPYGAPQVWIAGARVDPARVTQALRLAPQITAELDCQPDARVYQRGSWLMVEAPRADRRVVPLSRIRATRGAIPLGVATDRRVVCLDPAAGHVHALVAGQTGSGKSVALTTIAAGVCRQPETFELVALDLKPTDAPTFEPIRGAAALRWPVIEDVAGGEAAIVELEREMRRRQKDRPDRRLVIVVDEFHRLGAGAMTALAMIAAEGRSAGMHLILATQKVRSDIVDTRVTDQLAVRILGRMQSSMAAHWAGDVAAAGLIGKGDMLVDLAGDVRRVQIAYAPPDDLIWADIPRGAPGEPPEPEAVAGAHPSQEPRQLPADVLRWCHAFWMLKGRMPGVHKIATYAREQHGSCSTDVASRWQSAAEEQILGVSGVSGVSGPSLIRPDWGALRQTRRPDRATRSAEA